MAEQTNDAAAGKLSKRQFFELVIKITEHFVRFCALANAGGIVATMTLLGATAKEGEIENILALPLAFFALGVIFAGIAQIAALLKMRGQFPQSKDLDRGFRWMPAAMIKVGDITLFGGLGWFILGATSGVVIIAYA